MARYAKLTGVLSVFCLVTVAGEYHSCKFRENNWKLENWTIVKSPRWDYVGNWIQKDGYIENQTPEDATPAEMIGKRAGETYASMVLKKPFTGQITVRTTVAFLDRMAPLIVLAPELGEDDQGRPEYREHFEIVLYDKGINIWHHLWENEKPSWKKLAYWQFDLAPEAKHTMEVQLRRTTKGKQLVVKVAEREMGCMIDELPDQFYVGITGCEGINRFYDFKAASQ